MAWGPNFQKKKKIGVWGCLLERKESREKKETLLQSQGKDLIQGLCGTGEMSSFLHYPFLPAGSSQVGSPTWGLHGS